MTIVEYLVEGVLKGDIRGSDLLLVMRPDIGHEVLRRVMLRRMEKGLLSLEVACD